MFHGIQGMDTRSLVALVIAVFGSFSAAHASDVACDDVRLDGEGGSMQHVWGRNQGILPDCFAEAATEMADAYRFSHGDTEYGFQTSPMVTAIQTNTHSGSWNFRGDSIGEALNSIRLHGACNVNATIEKLGADKAGQIVTLLKEFLTRSYQDSRQYAKYSPMLDPFYNGRTAIPSGLLPNEALAIKRLSSGSAVNELDIMLTAPCEGANLRHPLLPKATPTAVGSWHTRQIIEYVAQHMHEPKDQPLAIAYCSTVLKQGASYMGLKGNGGVDPKDCESHASLIIGTRPKAGGGCEFLVRNSWGQTCGSHSAQWSCDNKTGSLWVDAGALARSIEEFDSFDRY